MGNEIRNDANLNDALREMVPDNGWKEVFAYGRGRHQWTPEELRVSFTEYLKFADGSPLPKDMKVSSKVGGKGGDVDEDTKRKVIRPYNMKSMCARLGIADWDKFKAKHCVETTDEGQEFIDLCARIENFIHGNLQEGATAGIYNAKMVMGLTDVAEHVKHEGDMFADKSDEELRAEVERMQALMGASE